MRVEIFDHMEQCTEAEVQRMLPLVSAQRREQALRFKHTLGRFCCLKSWVMLMEMLQTSTKQAHNSHQTPTEWQNFAYNEHGKPYIEGGPYFSISHCKEGIAVAVDDRPIGIDIEFIRHSDADLIARTMNEKEQLLIHSDRDFTRLWTQKEAVVKAIGIGIESFEQLQTILSKSPEWKISTIEKDKYIYSIAYE